VPLGRFLAAALRDLCRSFPELAHEALHALTPALEDLVPFDP
jgi:hypothetical protein